MAVGVPQRVFDDFTLIVTAITRSGTDGSIRTTTPMPYNSSDGNFDIAFAYTIGDPAALGTFTIFWQKDGSNVAGSPNTTKHLSLIHI